MKTRSKKSATRGDEDLLRKAGTVFSKAYVEMLKASGHDMVELEGEGSYLKDSQGRRYIDCSCGGGMYNLGRRNPEIVRRFKKAVYETDQGNFVMPSDYKALLAHRLACFVPGDLDCVLFGVTRGESMDAACKLARAKTARVGLVTVDGGCYGETGFALSLSQRKGKEQFGRLIPGVNTVPMGDVEAAGRAISDEPAAFVLEPIQVENHARMATIEYCKRIRDLCNDKGVVLIFDETQSGFGRTGTRFFFEQIYVEPDILIIGEAVTSGMFPMTAMVFTQPLKRVFDEHPLIHLCTFGGHDLGCEVAMAALDEYELQEPWKNAAYLGARLQEGIKGGAEESKGKAVSVEGRGLVVSMRLSAPGKALQFCSASAREGMFVEAGKVDASSVVFRPSLLVQEEEIDRIVEVTRKVLRAL